MVSILGISGITEEAGTLKDNNNSFKPSHHLTTANNLSTGINFNINTVDIDIDDLTHRSKALKKHKIHGTPFASFSTSGSLEASNPDGWGSIFPASGRKTSRISHPTRYNGSCPYS